MFNWFKSNKTSGWDNNNVIPLGIHVKFKDYVFDTTSTYSDYYIGYKNHIFITKAYMYNDEYGLDDEPEFIVDHVWLECVDDPNVKVAGYVDSHDLEEVR
jgi:hypothetical protein